MWFDVATHVRRLRFSKALSLAGAAAVALVGAAAPSHPAGAAALVGAADPHLAARAQAMSTGRAVLIGALTTEDSTTVANPDGSFTLATTALPTRMRNASGGWVSIDPALTRRADGSISTSATPIALTLSGGGRGPVVSIADRSGHAMALSVPVALPAPVLSGATATYSDVYRGIDLVVTAQASGGFSEVFVVHDAAAAAAAASLRFTTALRGLRLQQDASGNLRAVDTLTGQAVMTAPAPAMWDSAGGAGASSPDGPGPGAHTARLPVSVDGGGMTLTGDAAALGAVPTYPLFLDPTWTPPSTVVGGRTTARCRAPPRAGPSRRSTTSRSRASGTTTSTPASARTAPSTRSTPAGCTRTSRSSARR